QAERDLPSVLQRIAGAAVAEIEHVEYAGISLIERGAIRTAAATDPMVRRIDEMQYRVEQGPCLTSLQDQLTIRSNDLENDGRWPRFVIGAVAEGVRSMLSVQLFVEGANLGALNTYSTEINAYDDEDETVAILLAAHAAVAMNAAQVHDNLRIALEN